MYCRRDDLQNRTGVPGVEIEEQNNMVVMMRKIELAENQDKNLTLIYVGFIVKDREGRFFGRKGEREKKNKEREDKEKKREFTLEQLRLTQR